MLAQSQGEEEDQHNHKRQGTILNVFKHNHKTQQIIFYMEGQFIIFFFMLAQSQRERGEDQHNHKRQGTLCKNK
jgi:hypothetical protein